MYRQLYNTFYFYSNFIIFKLNAFIINTLYKSDFILYLLINY